MPDETGRPEPYPALLAVMPNGEAFKADRVSAVRILEEEPLMGCERPRFAVVVELADGSQHRIGGDLGQREAAELARQSAREVNERLLAGLAPARG